VRPKGAELTEASGMRVVSFEGPDDDGIQTTNGTGGAVKVTVEGRGLTRVAEASMVRL
jgi:hypothetical protein